jgi:hypothetical protein
LWFCYAKDIKAGWCTGGISKTAWFNTVKNSMHMIFPTINAGAQIFIRKKERTLEFTPKLLEMMLKVKGPFKGLKMNVWVKKL